MSIKRSAGILLPFFSLPSNYGIGTLGKEAFRFIDFLKNAKQSYWQILPIGPTSYGDSPYASLSSFAGNPYFIDLDILVEEGILKKKDLKKLQCDKPNMIDYSLLYNERFKALRTAFKCGKDKYKEEYDSFLKMNEKWLKSYSLFMAVKQYFNMRAWIDWPDEAIKLHQNEAINRYEEMLKDEIEFYRFIQFIFYKQYKQLKEYANRQGIKIIGDLPIYVALDSADVWSNPDIFQLNSVNLPTEVAGVPPDYFSEDGQLWGNPLYDWQTMKSDGYKWWIERIEQASKQFDVIRIDHFRGFESYWAVKYGELTAKNGQWKKGPGLSFVNMITSWFNNVDFIAEDLGILTQEVEDMLSASGLPGMRVMEFGLDKDSPGKNTPHEYIKNCVAYVGTHDNTTAIGWKETTSKENVENAIEYLGISKDEPFNIGLVRGAMSSVANLFIAQMQDYLGLSDDARINTPGQPANNWQWRMGNIDYDKLAITIAKMTKLYGRS